MKSNADVYCLSELHREEFHGPLMIPGYQVFVRWSVAKSDRLIKGIRHSEAVGVAVLVRDEFTAVRIPDCKHYLGIVSVKLLTEEQHLTVSLVYLPKSSNGKGSNAISSFFDNLVVLRKAGNPAIFGGDLNVGIERILKILRKESGTNGREYDVYGQIKPVEFKGSPTSWGKTRFCAAKQS